MQSFVYYSDPSVAVVAGSNASVVRCRLVKDEGETHHDLLLLLSLKKVSNARLGESD